jgi:hypothetical protein
LFAVILAFALVFYFLLFITMMLGRCYRKCQGLSDEEEDAERAVDSVVPPLPREAPANEPRRVELV